MRRWLVLEIEAPLLAFGGVVVDQFGPVRDFPGASMLTGLIGNALGWSYTDGPLLQSLQQRLIFASRIDREGSRLTDLQTVALSPADAGWTTRGTPETRANSSYAGPHLRWRDYLSDAKASVVLRLSREAEPPRLQDIAHALDFPERPLFIGRKTCLPSTPLLPPGAARWVDATTAHEALCALPGAGQYRASWPAGEGPETPEHSAYVTSQLSDRRNWITGLQSGSRRVVEGRVSPRSAS